MKLCPKCNRTYDDSWGICLYDNAKLIQMKEGEVPPSIIEDEETRGFGGWLAFYVWSSLIIWPVVLFLIWFNAGIFTKTGTPKIFLWYDKSILTAIGIADIYACYTLSRLKPKGVVLAKGVLLVQIIYQLIWIVATLIILITGREPVYKLTDAIGGLLAYLIWYQYFTKSKRIRNTFEKA